jgi:hypothetical protein
MNYFLKLRFAIWAIVALSVIILATVGTMLFFTLNGKQERNNNNRWDEKKRHEQMENFFRNELGFSPEQEKTANEYRNEAFKEMRVLFDSLEKKRTAIIDELGKSAPDTVLLFKMSEETGALHAKIRYNAVHQLLRLRSICTPAQVQKLNKLNNQIIRPEGPMRRQGRKEGPERDRKAND